MELSASDMIDRIKSLVTAKELELIGINQKTLSSWKVRNIFPKSDDLYRIAKHLGVSMEYLLTGEKESGALPDDIQKTVSKLLMLTPAQRSPLNAVIASQVEFWKKEIPGNSK